jgi:serine/threonine-protein kinase
VHRDIKPANVMLTRTGDVKVMDFGIARAMNDPGTTMTQASAVMGTAQYLSPEQARGEVVDARSDLYSTGVLLYELLTGRPPFTGDSPVSIAYQHVSEMPVPPSQVDDGVTPEVDAIVLHALAKRTDDRYQSASEFRADIERAIAGSPVTAAVPAITADRTQMMPPVAAATGAYEPMYDLQRPRRGRKSIVFWILGLIGLAAAVVGAVLIFKFVPWAGGSQVQVPNLRGLTVEEATSTLQQYQLKLGAQAPQTSDKPLNTIIAQQPESGETLEQGQSVNVTVSTGLEQVTVPQLLALTSVDAARLALQDAGLQLGAIKEKNSQQPAGYVLAQLPEEGTQVDAGSPVDITVSSGLVKVPTVTGVSEAQARSDLAQAGFDVQIVDIEDGSVSAGTVLAQSPQGGELLPRGAIVTITVATSPPAPTMAPQPTTDPNPEPSLTPPSSEPLPSEFAPSPAP